MLRISDVCNMTHPLHKQVHRDHCSSNLRAVSLTKIPVVLQRAVESEVEPEGIFRRSRKQFLGGVKSW